jgi:hypothetical protein
MLLALTHFSMHANGMPCACRIPRFDYSQSQELSIAMNPDHLASERQAWRSDVDALLSGILVALASVLWVADVHDDHQFHGAHCAGGARRTAGGARCFWHNPASHWDEAAHGGAVFRPGGPIVQRMRFGRECWIESTARGDDDEAVKVAGVEMDVEAAKGDEAERKAGHGG